MHNKTNANVGLGTLVNHFADSEHPNGAHLPPIYQTSTFGFPDVETGRAIFAGEQSGYIYTRGGNPNANQLAQKYAAIEGWDLLKQSPDVPPEQIVQGKVVASGMGAIAAAALGKLKAGDTAVVQRELYGNSFSFWYDLAPRLGINVVWVAGANEAEWEAAFNQHKTAVIAYIETPSNPQMGITNIPHLVKVAHAHSAWIMVDNTFATPYHTRPLTLGCDIVVHSTTKYLSGHGQIIGGAIVSRHPEFFTTKGDGIRLTGSLLGAVPSPFDCWLATVGLKTFEVRMAKHAKNGQKMAQWLTDHPKIDRVFYPGLEDHPGHQIAKNQMENGFGGMLGFELKGGYDAGVTLMNNVQLPTLAVSLGNVDSLIQHPASMTHAVVPPHERKAAGIEDGLIRLSVGIENIEDLIADMAAALHKA